MRTKYNAIILSIWMLIMVSTTPAVGESGQLPSGFPSDIPIGDFMTITGANRIKANDFHVTLNAPNISVPDLVQWFKSQYGAAGWTLQGEQILPQRASCLLPRAIVDAVCP